MPHPRARQGTVQGTVYEGRPAPCAGCAVIADPAPRPLQPTQTGAAGALIDMKPHICWSPAIRTAAPPTRSAASSTKTAPDCTDTPSLSSLFPNLPALRFRRRAAIAWFGGRDGTYLRASIIGQMHSRTACASSRLAMLRGRAFIALRRRRNAVAERCCRGGWALPAHSVAIHHTPGSNPKPGAGTETSMTPCGQGPPALAGGLSSNSLSSPPILPRQGSTLL